MDAWNEEDIAEHGVKHEEAESVVHGARRPFPRAIEPEKYLVRGKSDSNRYLQVIYVRRPVDTIDVQLLDPMDRLNVDNPEEVVYIIHARDLSSGERRTIRQRG